MHLAAEDQGFAGPGLRPVGDRSARPPDGFREACACSGEAVGLQSAGHCIPLRMPVLSPGILHRVAAMRIRLGPVPAGIRIDEPTCRIEIHHAHMQRLVDVADQMRQLHPARAAGVLFWSALFRLGIIPALMLGLVRWLPCSVEVKRVIVVQAAMPAGVFPIVLSRLYGGDPATAVRIVAGTTILSLVTIPLWIRWGMAWLQLAP